MPGDAFYTSKTWRRLRVMRLQIDHYRCTTPGCGWPAAVVDHVIARKDGGTNEIGNLRSLCRSCDNQIKEHADGARRSGGKPRAIGCGVDGWPLDPSRR